MDCSLHHNGCTKTRDHNDGDGIRHRTAKRRAPAWAHVSGGWAKHRVTPRTCTRHNRTPTGYGARRRSDRGSCGDASSAPSTEDSADTGPPSRGDKRAPTRKCEAGTESGPRGSKSSYDIGANDGGGSPMLSKNGSMVDGTGGSDTELCSAVLGPRC